MKKPLKIFAAFAAAGVLSLATLPLAACSNNQTELVLRVSNWEEYIDLGGWKDDELIDIDNPFLPDSEGIIGNNSLIDDFTEWFNSGNHGFTIKVEYSTFGTNEDLYNRLNLGDTYDLICPSDYLIMQLLNEGKAEKYSESFHDPSIETNYYARNVSPYIDGVFEENGWKEYAACYMLGTTGIVYNPEMVTPEDASSWSVLKNSTYKRQVTVKDNVRDSYFAALGIHNAEELLSDEITEERRNSLLNSTDDETIASALEILKDIKNNVYSFETDSGKSDMITGKVVANYQWSGDGVYIMDQADEDETNPVELWYSVPDECTNLWFDGWIMLKDGIAGNEQKKIAAEAFVNFLSRPDNAIRNMYYIGYTSAIADDTVFNYLDWNYGAVFDPEDDYYDGELLEICEYDLSYFFGEGYSIYIDASQIEIDLENATPQKLKLGEEYGNDTYYLVYPTPEKVSRGRQVFAQYPHRSVIDRSVVMLDFGDRLSAINRMWINVRCLAVKDFNPAVVWSVVGILLAGTVAIILYRFRYQIFYRRPDKIFTNKK